jgi:N-acetylglutamate synthase-like GNAT family acetyltransferase
MKPVAIRKATKNDLPDILNLYVQVGFDDQETLHLPSAERIFEQMHHYPCYDVYVAIRDEKVIGTFALLIMDNLAHHGASSGVVEDVAVSSDCQGQGVGKQMMAYAMKECQKAGCYKLSLSSNMKREDAHRFYEEIGFEKHGYSYLVRFEQ